MYFITQNKIAYIFVDLIVSKMLTYKITNFL